MLGEKLQLFFESVTGQVVTVIVIFLLLVLIMKITKRKNSVEVMVKSAILIAVTYVLNNITLFSMPQGGSITFFGMLPLFLIGYLFGPRQGILAGMAYGLLDLAIKPYVVHPMQIFLDYPLAFGAIGIGGLLRDQKYGLINGYILGVLGRYMLTVISGIIFWGEYAAEGFNAVTWSFYYNMTYMLPEAILTVIVLIIPQVKHLFAKYKIKEQ